MGAKYRQGPDSSKRNLKPAQVSLSDPPEEGNSSASSGQPPSGHIPHPPLPTTTGIKAQIDPSTMSVRLLSCTSPLHWLLGADLQSTPHPGRGGYPPVRADIPRDHGRLAFSRDRHLTRDPAGRVGRRRRREPRPHGHRSGRETSRPAASPNGRRSARPGGPHRGAATIHIGIAHIPPGIRSPGVCRVHCAAALESAPATCHGHAPPG